MALTTNIFDCLTVPNSSFQPNIDMSLSACKAMRTMRRLQGGTALPHASLVVLPARSGAKGVSSALNRETVRAVATAAPPEKPRHVLKFGGSSVGNADAFRSVAGVILADRDAGNSVIGVLSAMLGVTNRLLDAARAAASGDTPTTRSIRAELLDLHARTAKDLVRYHPRHASNAMEYIESTLKQYYDNVCEEIAAEARISAYAMDRISSVGERWSTQLMHAYMRDRGVDAPFVESDTIIVTDHVSGNAKPLLGATRDKVSSALRPMLERGATPLVTGFFGASEGGKLTTLGRGGSDLTAAVLGHCVDASEVSLWKVEYTTAQNGRMDRWVHGWEGVVHDAEPSVTIPSLAYEEAAELAHFGKKVLHPETVMPAVEKGIPIAVRNTINPSHPGTRIEWCAPAAAAARVQAITRLPLKAYEEKNCKVVDLDLQALHMRREEAALVALVGINIMSIEGLANRVIDILRTAGIPVHVPKRVNGSPNNLCVVVPDSKRNEAVKMLHEVFIKGGVLLEPALQMTSAEPEWIRIQRPEQQLM